MTSLTLSNGAEIPAMGLGTWRSKPDDVFPAVLHALSVGYRHIDAAEIYGNESDIGRAIDTSDVPRSEVFITSKLWNTHWSAADSTKALEATLDKLKTDFLDLYLVHWPGPAGRPEEVWPALEKAVDTGKVRSIGLSNFPVHRIASLAASARIKPVVNQVECHPHLQNIYLRDYCREAGVTLEAYAPLKSDHIADLLGNKTLKQIAADRSKTVPQIVLRWHVQRGVVPVPKSVTPSRITENFQIFGFELSAEEMKRIRGINRGERHFPDPDDVEFGFPVE